MEVKEMLDYLLSTGLYKKYADEKYPYDCLHYEQRMMETEKTVPIRKLVERFIEMGKWYNGEPWDIMQILANINMITPVEDR